MLNWLGLHMMDALTPDLFVQRLDQFVFLLRGAPKSTVSHLELASMANAVFVKQIAEKVGRLIDWSTYTVLLNFRDLNCF